MKKLLLIPLILALSGCMTVNVTTCGGDVSIQLDKAVSTMPVNAEGNTVPVSAIP